MDLQPGQILDNKYRIVRLVGEGGMGAVFEGENTRIMRRVAIKVLNHAASADSNTVMRFEREAQAAGHIGSDHILEVLDLGVLPDGARYMVMEFLEGQTLSQRIQSFGRLNGAQTHAIVRQALVGLKAAHQAGIIHRDLKPDNLFLVRKRGGQEDFVKIIDFGISKFNALSGDMSMTRTGAVMGTPYYMSPEQAKGATVDARSDVYAIGVIMYEALTGRVPFDGNTFNELMFKIVLSEPAPLAEVCPDLDPGLAQIVMRAMARDVTQRFASADDLLQALDAWKSGGGAHAVAPATHSAVPTVSAPLTQPSASAQAKNTPQFSTAGSWATSQTDTTAYKPPSKAVPAVLAAVGLLVISAGAFGAYKLVSARGAAAVSSGVPAVSAPAVEAASATPPAPPAPPSEVKAPDVSATAPAPSVEPTPSVASAAPAKPAAKAAPAAPVRRASAPAAPAKPKTDRDFGY